MADDMDRAQALDNFDRDVAMANTRARIDAARQPRNRAVDGLCIDCGEAIEPARQQALRHCTSRCADCAGQHAQRRRMAR